MKPKVKQEGDIEKINKFIGYQLPNKFKIVGLVLFIISIISVPIISSYLGELQHRDLFERIAWTFAVLGLLMISISKEKMEDELMIKIRLQSYNYAVMGAVLLYLIMPFVNYALYFNNSYTPKMNGSKDVAVLALLLTIQILTFRKLKKAYNEE
ncbi:hypothetical protein [Flavobacterium sp. DSR2-3-3]|uniref:hypothetical protein n=1 Tax=Flavobacterium sp. DSR2-3-3 TaxID=2804632 RepID=UPI003CE7D930